MFLAVRKALLVVLAVVVMMAAGTTPADAALRAKAKRVGNVASGSWGMVLKAAAAPAPAGSTGAFVYTSTDVAGLSKPMFVTATNVGTLALLPRSRVTYLVSSKTATGLNLFTNVKVSSCVGGVWNETLGTCSGTIQVVAIDDGVTRPAPAVSYPAAPNGIVRLRIEQNTVLAVGTTITLGVRVAW